MATLGSTTCPTWGDGRWQVPSATAGVLTLPPGGPWLITGLGMWMSGVSGWPSPSVRLVLWNASGTRLAYGAAFNPTASAYPNGSTSRTAAISYGPVSGGASVYVGYAFANSGSYGVQFSFNSTGLQYYDTVASNTSNCTFSSRVGAPGVWLTYTAYNTKPDPPTLTSPVGTLNNQTPTFSFVPSDPNADTSVAYTIQVSSDSTFAAFPAGQSWNPGSAAGSWPNGSTVTTPASPSLARGLTYYWRVMTSDTANGYGGYSASSSFTVPTLPVAVVTQPAAGTLAKLYFAAGAAGTPRLEVSWSYADGDGHSQSSAIVKVCTDAGMTANVSGSPFSVSGSATTLATEFSPAQGAVYYVTVQSTCTAGYQGAASSAVNFKCRWGRASYRASTSPPPVSWASPIVSSSIPASSALIMEYAATATTAEPSAWYADIGSAPLGLAYAWHRVTMFAWGSAPASPSVYDVTLRWGASGSFLDLWNLSLGGGPSMWAIDEGAKVYGSQSLKGIGLDGSVYGMAYQIVDVSPNTVYTLQGRVKSLGNSSALLEVKEVAGLLNAPFAATAVATATQDWTRVSVQFNSGGRTQVGVLCTHRGAAGAAAWFDAIKVEASAIVNPWSPGYVGKAAVVDAGGVQIDGRGGGILRLVGSAGGARDVVELGLNGLKFGGDVNLYSPSSGHASLAGDLIGPGVPATQLNLQYNGSFQMAWTVPSPGFSPYNWSVAPARITTGGHSDGNSLQGSAYGPSVEARTWLGDVPVIPGRTMTVNCWVRNPNAGSPTVGLYVLGRRMGTASGGYDFVHGRYDAWPPDGGGWVRLTGTFTLAADEWYVYIAPNLVTNPGVGGYTTTVQWDDFMLEYGTHASDYLPSLRSSTWVWAQP